MDRPSFINKVKGDGYLKGFTLSFAIIIPLIILFLMMREDTIVTVYLLLLVGLIEFIVILYRSAWINKVYDNGMLVKGVVVKVFRFGNRSYVKVEYMFETERFSRKILMLYGMIRQFQEDQPVDLVVDKYRPKRVVIKKMFDDK